MSLEFSTTQRVSGNTRLSNNISEALIKALGINNLKNDATVNELKDAISAKLSAISGGTQLYKHSIPVAQEQGGEVVLNFEVVTASSTPYTNFEELYVGNEGYVDIISILTSFVLYINDARENSLEVYLINGSGIETGSVYTPSIGFSDTVTTL